jgi:hypothetical protein
MTQTKQCAAESPAEVELLTTATTFAVVGEGAVTALGHSGKGRARSIKCCVPLPGSRSGIFDIIVRLFCFAELAADLGPTPGGSCLRAAPERHGSIAPSACGNFKDRTADDSGERQRACE